MKRKKIKSERAIRNGILLALHKRHGRGRHVHRNKKRHNDRQSWRKEEW
jgi:hypothetical protein